MQTETFFDEQTSTFTHILWDEETLQAAVIDSVLNYNQDSGHISTKFADVVIAFLKSRYLKLEWILETHIHADHLTAAQYIKERMGGKIAIGARIQKVLETWVPIFNTANDTPVDASQFDYLFQDGEVFNLGNLQIKVMYTPGHTPACSCYIVEDAIFVGDTIFMPDVGTARTDFPGGSAGEMYDSIQKILSLPDATRIFLCHDYPPEGRKVSFLSTVGEERTKNILINQTITKQEYIQTRNKKDEGKAVPKLLLPSIQVNLRAGNFGSKEENGTNYIKIPINRI